MYWELNSGKYKIHLGLVNKHKCFPAFIGYCVDSDCTQPYFRLITGRFGNPRVMQSESMLLHQI